MLLIRMLGSLSLERDGVLQARLEGQRYGAILAHLALRPGRALSRETIIATHWPGVAPSVARNRLSVALHALRKILEEGDAGEGTLLHTDRQCVALDPVRVQTDIQQFEQACEAARCALDPASRRAALEAAWRLYAGPLLQGFPEEEWLSIERERLACAQEDIEKALQIEEAVPQAAPATTAAPPPETATAALPETAVLAVPPLPQPLTRFFGRQAELSTLRELVRGGARLVTLLGAGGMGKTRLALEGARCLLEDGLRGVSLWAPLADVASPEALERTLLLSAGMESAALGDPVLFLARQLSGQRALLVVDNTEHLVDAVAEILDRLLSRTPDLVVMVTSQRTLLLDGEHVLRLGPLAGEGAAAALLLDRLRYHRPDYQPDRAESEALEALVHHLDAMPLALELAAARLRQGSVAVALRDLDLSSLVDRRRQRPQRQRSLEEALEWTLSLVSAPQREVFVQLSVFRGEISVEAAAAVLGRPGLGEVLLELADSSLLVPVESAADRYRMLPTVRALAAARVPADEREALRERFSAWWIEVARRWWVGLNEGRSRDMAVVLERDWSNLEAALDMVPPMTAAMALTRTVIFTLWSSRARVVLPRLAALSALPEAAGWPQEVQVNVVRCGHRLAVVSGQAEAARHWRTRAQAFLDAGLPEEKATALWSELLVSAIDRGELSRAREIGERLVRFEEGSGRLRNLVVHQDALARALFFAGEFAAARALGERSLVVLEGMTDPQLQEVVELLLASCLLEQREVEQGAALVDALVSRRRALGQPLGASLESNLATVRLLQGELVAARQLAEAGCRSASGDTRLQAYAQNVMSQVLLAEERWAEAEAAAARAEAAFVEMVRPIERPRPALLQAISQHRQGRPEAEATLRRALASLLAIEGAWHLQRAQDAVALIWPHRIAALEAACRTGSWRECLSAWIAPTETPGG